MRKLIILLLLLASSFSYAQTKYYTTDGKNRLTETEIESMLSETESKMSKAFGKKVYAGLTIEETVTKQDSFISKVSIKISDVKKDKSFYLAPLSEYKDKEFPKFNLNMLTDGKFNSEQLKGKPTMINFWFTNCPPCIDEMPVLNKIKEKYKDDFNFIAITFDKKNKVENFLKKHAFNFEHLIDAKDFTDKLGIKTYPMNLFLDKNGLLKYVEGGIPYEGKEGKELKMGDGNEFIEILEELKQL